MGKYILRIVPIRVSEKLALASLDKVQNGKELQESAVMMMIQGCKDTISNVRLVSAQALISFLKCGDPSVQNYTSDIRQALEPLAKDIDDDVKYFGVQALGLLRGQ